MEPEEAIHIEATLLPAYVSRTLSKEEQQQMEEHLKTCPICPRELQEIIAMQAILKTAVHQRPGPSPDAFSKVMSRIHQDIQHTPRERHPQTTPSLWERIEQTFRSLFEVRWAPALASFLIVGQAVLLLSVLGGPETMKNGPIRERGIPQGTPVIPIFHIQVEFVGTAQEGRLRGLVQELGGTIIDGPTPEGLYTLRFEQRDSRSPASILSTLQTQPDLIKSAKSLQP